MKPSSSGAAERNVGRVDDGSPLSVTLALHVRETCLPTIASFQPPLSAHQVDGLVEVLAAPPSARAAVKAIEKLATSNRDAAQAAILEASFHEQPSIRLAAVEAMGRAKNETANRLSALLRSDISWWVRRAALSALAEAQGAHREAIYYAADDPHWRVRHALLRALLPLGVDDHSRESIDRRLAAVGRGPRVEGLRAYLAYRWSGRGAGFEAVPSMDNALHRWPFWDWDGAVLTRSLARMSDDERRECLDFVPLLLEHEDERVRRWAVETLHDDGQPSHLAQAVALFAEPRTPAIASVEKLLSRLTQDQIEAAARWILHDQERSPHQLAWAIDQAEAIFPALEEAETLTALMQRLDLLPMVVRAAIARLARRWRHEMTAQWKVRLRDDVCDEVRIWAVDSADSDAACELLASSSPEVREAAAAALLSESIERATAVRLANDASWKVRRRLAQSLAEQGDSALDDVRKTLQQEGNPFVRAAALTQDSALAIVADPNSETSWHVISQAARLAKTPRWELEPQTPWKPHARESTAPASFELLVGQPMHGRPLGSAQTVVSAMGISGHYGLPPEGFEKAVAEGVNLFFWEPNYATLTQFCRRTVAAERNQLHFLAGTFEADGERVRRDAERALRQLKIDRLSLFLLFWVKSWRRVSPDVQQTLDELKCEGKIAMYGLSTHSRALAVEAIQRGYNPVMVRHSFAHRKAEREVLPAAMEHAVGVITFNNTCYGRLLKRIGGSPGVDAADCYRYTLSQPGVTTCFSAPATLEQLDENLAALRDPRLPSDRQQRALSHGKLVYEEDTTFRRLVRAF